MRANERNVLIAKPLSTLAEKIRVCVGKASFKFLNVAEEDHRTKIVSEIDAEVRRLDILINNAGINVLNTLTDISLEQLNKLLNVNLSGAFLKIQACAPLMKHSGGGSIVNLGSTAGIMGHHIIAYSASNEALVG